MKAIIEVLSNENGSAETIIVTADEIDQRNGWILAWKGESIVAAANEKFVKYFLLCEEY